MGRCIGLFGADQVLAIEEFDLLEGTGGKVIQYTSVWEQKTVRVAGRTVVV